MEEKLDRKRMIDMGNENEAELEIVELDSHPSGSEGSEGGSSKRMKACSGTAFSSRSSLQFKKLPPFVEKMWDMMENEEIKSIVSWSSNGTSFVIWDAHSFAATVLPVYFKHNNLQSFVGQLNSYGFKKLTWDRWEYGNEYFQKGEKHLLEHIKRKVQLSRRTQPASGRRRPEQASGSSIGPLTHTSPAGNSNKVIEISTKEHDLLKQEIIKLKACQGNLEEKIASIKIDVLTNKQRNEQMFKLMSTWINLMKKRQRCNTSQPSVLVKEEETVNRNRKGDEKTEDGSSEAEPNAEAVKRKWDPVSCSEPQEQDTRASSMEHTRDFMSQNFSWLEKMALVDEEEMGKKYTSNPLEDLFGDSPEWTEYVKRMGKDASLS